MRKWVLALLFSGGLAGCAATREPAPVSELPQPMYLDRAAGALVFDPPIAAGQPPLTLARSHRQPGAFVGYQDLVTTWFYHRRDDWQMDGFPDQYTQRAISERQGVRYR